MEHLRDEELVLVRERGAVLCRPQLHTSASGEACSVDPRVIDCSAYCTSMKTIDKDERHD